MLGKRNSDKLLMTFCFSFV